jgi:hypothetical protein
VLAFTIYTTGWRSAASRASRRASGSCSEPDHAPAGTWSPPVAAELDALGEDTIVGYIDPSQQPDYE